MSKSIAPTARDLVGRVALVTGAGTGMGAATASLFAQHGAAVVVADVNEEAGRATVDSIRSEGGEAHGMGGDVPAIVTAAVERSGRLDCTVSNVAVPPGSAPIADLDPEVLDRVVAVDLRGVALFLKYEIRQFLSQGTLRPS